MVSDLFNLLRVAVGWQILTELLEEVLHAIRSSTRIQYFTHALSIYLVFLLTV